MIAQRSTIVGADSVARRHHLVLQELREGSRLTLRQVCERTGLSHAAVASSMAALRDRHIVSSDGTTVAQGLGRPSALWALRPTAAYVVGIDVGAKTVRATLLDLTGQTVHACHDDTTALVERAPSGDAVLKELAALVQRTVSTSPLPAVQPVAAAVAISGLIDAARGICLTCANIPGWRDLPVAARLTELLGIDVLVDDSACAQALAEQRYGVARGTTDFLFVNVGVGIGAALYMEGRLYRGPGGLAGELGHITVDEQGPLCGCGNRGCAEALVGAPAIARRARELLSGHAYPSVLETALRRDATDSADAPTVEQIAAAAAAGDKVAFRVLNDAGEHLGVAVTAAVNLLGLPLVVLGGGIVRSGEPFVGAVQRTVMLRALPPLAAQVRIVPSSLDDAAAARGAGLSTLDRYMATLV